MDSSLSVKSLKITVPLIQNRNTGLRIWDCIIGRPYLIRLEIKHRDEQIFAHRMPIYIFPAQRYRSLIFMGFVHSKFGSLANELFVNKTHKVKCGIVHQGLTYNDILKQGPAGYKTDENTL